MGILAADAVASTNRVLNLSSRSTLSPEGFIAGFVVGPGDPKPVLIRVVGPSLEQFPGISGVVPNPKLEIFDAAGRLLVVNRDWMRATAGTEIRAADFAAVGAFPFTSQADAAVLTALKPGAYTVRASSEDGRNGLSMIEVYDKSGEARLINLSTRTHLSPDSPVFDAGLVVAPGGSRRVLIRAIGPALAAFGVTSLLPDPLLTVRDVTGTRIGFNERWGESSARGTLEAAFLASGAFPFVDSGSRDCALILDLAPGAYTAQVSSATNRSGTMLFELYDLGPTSPVTTSPSPGAGGGSGTSGATAGNGVSGGGGATTPATPADSGSETVLYTASLRLPDARTATSASGHATLLLSGARDTVTVSLQFAGLSSPQVSAHLRVGTEAVPIESLVALPGGPLNGFVWTLRPAGRLGVAEILAALEEGRVYMTVETETFSSGELVGRFLRANGSIVFRPPAPASAIADLRLTPVEAGRFLTQATFGPTQTEIESLAGGGLEQLHAWIDAQMAVPASSHLEATRNDYERFTRPATPQLFLTQTNRHAAWWAIAIKGRDQLRQRVAFALSQIFVVSETHPILFDRAAEVAAYNDLLARHAFGNFRALLEDVTLSPVMGVFLSHLHNARAEPAIGGAPGTLADENYAREVMQLFTLGRTQLHPDGSQKLDAGGLTLPTYDEVTVKDMARVFTGWGFAATAGATGFRTGPADYFSPMQLYPEYHDDKAKVIVGGRALSAGQGGRKDLADTLDTLFHHPNTAPFFARQLIQRLVTSNPTPGYIYRVARVFEDNGRGVRGDLGAVVRAVLLDYEARSPAAAADSRFGKLREPLLRLTVLLRSLGADSNSGRLAVPVATTDAFGQTPLRAASVFSFFEPDFVRPGPLANAGLYSPEFQTLNAATLVTVTNALNVYLNTRASTAPDDPMVTLRLNSTEVDAARDAAGLVERLEARLAGGRLPTEVKARIVSMLAAFPVGTRDELESRYRSVAYLILASPFGAIQR